MKNNGIDAGLLTAVREHLRNPEISASNTLNELGRLATDRPSALLYPALTNLSDKEMGFGQIAGYRFKVKTSSSDKGKYSVTFYTTVGPQTYEQGKWCSLITSSPYNPPAGADYYVAGIYFKTDTLSRNTYTVVREEGNYSISKVELESLISNLTGRTDWNLEDSLLSLYDDLQVDYQDKRDSKEENWLSASVPECFQLKHYLDFCTSTELLDDVTAEEADIPLYQLIKGEETVVGYICEHYTCAGNSLVKVVFNQEKLDFIANYERTLMRLTHHVELGVTIKPGSVTVDKCYLIEDFKRK